MYTGHDEDSIIKRLWNTKNFHTEDMALPVPLALAAIPASPDPSASPGPLSLSASAATSLSPWLSLYSDTEIITNDILNMDN